MGQQASLVAEECLALMRKFFDLVHRPDGSCANWLETWSMFLDDDWYKQQLRRRIRRRLRRFHKPYHWFDDAMQEAQMALGRQLKRTPDLNVDWERASGRFEPWMGQIIERNGKSGIRAVRRKYESQLSAAGRGGADSSQPDASLSVAAVVDTELLLAHLPDLPRTVVSLYGRYSLSEIGELVNKPKWEVQRILRAGLDQLRRIANQGLPERCHPEKGLPESGPS